MAIDLDSPPNVRVAGIVRAPIDQVWALYRSYGEPMMKWWPIYESVRIDGDGQDEIGAIRILKTKAGRTYAEKLIERDDTNHVERYDMLSVEPAVPTFKGAITKVAMTDQGDGTTRVEWRSWSDAGRILMGQITSTQRETYAAAIQSLDRHFHPALGSLEVTIVAGKGLANGSHFPTSAYVLVELGDAAPERSRARHLTDHPIFNQTFTLPVLDERGRLQIGVWDEKLGRDLFLGAAVVDLHTLASGVRTPLTLSLQGSEGPAGGTLDVELRLHFEGGEALPPTREQQQLHTLAVVEDALSGLQAHALQLVQQAMRGPQETWGYARYARSPQLPDLPLERLPRMVEGLPPEAVMSPEKLSRVVRRGLEYLYSQADFVARSEASDDPFRAYFGGWIKAPEKVLERWQDDRELARQFLQGPGPLLIERLTSTDKVPASMRELSPGGDTLEALASENRLFLLDYQANAALKPYRDMVLYAPIVLVYKEKESGKLTIGAIQLERDGGPVYTPDRTPPNRWALAKLHVACADNQYHQFIYHLGYAHLAMEPLGVATHNALPADHPVAVLLAPHFHDTLGVNFLARQTLVSDIVPFTDRTFSPGTAQALQLFLSAWETYDFFDKSFPADLAARGFDEAGTDGLTDYYFRDDGFLVWNALGEYTTGFVDALYADDAAVAADPHLQAWAREATDPDKADFPGFPTAFHDRALLSKTLQTLIWAVSAQHSAVNFSQYEFLTYVPNRPDSLFATMPEGEEEIDASVFHDALPNPMIGHFQVLFAYLLTTPSTHPLTELRAVEALCPEVHQRFQAHLAEIAARIAARDAELVARGEAPYPYLSPDRIASSIAI